MRAASDSYPSNVADAFFVQLEAGQAVDHHNCFPIVNLEEYFPFNHIISLSCISIARLQMWPCDLNAIDPGIRETLNASLIFFPLCDALY